MQFDPTNKIVQLCGEGMLREGEGKPDEARRLFQQAWKEASNPFEQCIAAHYVARHQTRGADKLKWDEISLQYALEANVEGIREVFPSLYLNIGKGYEELKDLAEARKNYQLAQSFAAYLPNDGYGKMIRSGIASGLGRVQEYA